MIGWNPKDFLQCDETEKESINLLSESLRSSEPISTIITNKNGHDKIFKQLVIMKPVFDSRGNDENGDGDGDDDYGRDSCHY